MLCMDTYSGVPVTDLACGVGLQAVLLLDTACCIAPLGTQLWLGIRVSIHTGYGHRGNQRIFLRFLSPDLVVAAIDLN